VDTVTINNMLSVSISNISNSNSGRFAMPPKVVVRKWIWLACRW